MANWILLSILSFEKVMLIGRYIFENAARKGVTINHDWFVALMHFDLEDIWFQ